MSPVLQLKVLGLLGCILILIMKTLDDLLDHSLGSITYKEDVITTSSYFCDFNRVLELVQMDQLLLFDSFRVTVCPSALDWGAGPR